MHRNRTWAGIMVLILCTTPLMLGEACIPPERDEPDDGGSDAPTGPEDTVAPDLVVSSLTHSPVNPTAQDTITFTATVRNQGTASCGPSTLSFKVSGESDPVTFEIPALAPGESYSVDRQETLAAQSYTSTATADVDNEVAESNEMNNVTVDRYSVSGDGDTGTPDLVVSSLTHSPENPTMVDMITFTATVTNVGTGTAGASMLEFAVGSESDPPIFPIPELGPGESFAVDRQAMLIAQHYLNTATADVGDDVAESNEINNVTIDTYMVSEVGL